MSLLYPILVKWIEEEAADTISYAMPRSVVQHKYTFNEEYMIKHTHQETVTPTFLPVFTMTGRNQNLVLQNPKIILHNFMHDTNWFEKTTTLK